jgi:hypothetical protein
MCMKNICFIFCLLMVSAVEIKACEICGCGIGNNYIGILPEFNKNILGVRYRYNSMLTHVGVGGTTTYLTSSENYNTVEIWGAANISDNFRLTASVPYSFDELNNQGKTSNKNGIGDISVAGFYQLIHSRKTIINSKLLVQSLWLGVGVKLPTGQYNPLDKSAIVESANLFQLGTGSTDFNFTIMYDLRVQDAGLNLTAGYRVNTVNKYEYRYGNKFSINAQPYYKFRTKSGITLAPNAGVQYETGQKDLDHSYTVDISGGNLLLGTVGIETSYKKIALGANWQTPLSQNLANGIIKANNRLMIHVAILL